MYTPGPWTVGGDTYPIGILAPHRFGAGDPEVICWIGADIMTPEDPEECEANARLIAAAPDMLAALYKLVSGECVPPSPTEGGRFTTLALALIKAQNEARAILREIDNSPSGESEVR